MTYTPATIHIKLSDTLELSHCANPRRGDFGFWLYDKTRGMNLSMRAKTSTEAFVEALTYYQERLTEVEAEHKALKDKVDVFVAQFMENEDD